MSDLDFDRQHIWHPYTAVPGRQPVYPVASAEGAMLQLEDGRQLIDGMSSWWSVIHGYNHPRLNAAAHQQIDSMAHVMFGGLTHQPAIELAERLIKITPESLDKIFFCDSGSVSVEVALKMALQYWQAQDRPEKSRFLALQGGYHGDTFGAMSVCDPVNGMHHLFSAILPKHFFVPRPAIRFGVSWEGREIEVMENLLKTHGHQIAAVIVEPVVQGAGGMWFYHPEYLAAVRRLCDRHHVLLIADEIATGFGRTGKLFACEHAEIVPDILCLGKALTGGYMTLAAALTTDRVATTISESQAGCFMHGPTFMANPLACRVAMASIDELLAAEWQANIARIERQLSTGLQCCREITGVADVRVLGAIGVVELEAAVDVSLIQQRLVQQGVWLRPFGRLIYTMPPYICSDLQLQKICSAIVNAIKE